MVIVIVIASVVSAVTPFVVYYLVQRHRLRFAASMAREGHGCEVAKMTDFMASLGQPPSRLPPPCGRDNGGGES
jgi:hypothetical protein